MLINNSHFVPWNFHQNAPMNDLTKYEYLKVVAMRKGRIATEAGQSVPVPVLYF